MEIKKCCKCNKELPIEMFNRQKQSKDGFQSMCRECTRIYNKENKEKISKKKSIYYNENKEQLKEYYLKNKERISEQRKYKYKEARTERLEQKKRYYEENKDTLVERSKRYYTHNRRNILEQRKKYNKENKEKISIKNKKYVVKNKEKLKKYAKAYYKENSNKCRIYNQRRRARKSLVPNNLTSEQWENTKLYFNNKCAYCGETLPLEQEHFIPLSKGGEYTINNIIPSCKSCNCSKNDSDFFDWYPRYKYYSKKREHTILKFLGYKDNKQQLSLI